LREKTVTTFLKGF